MVTLPSLLLINHNSYLSSPKTSKFQMSTWKLTKKLKETHISSAFSRGRTPSTVPATATPADPSPESPPKSHLARIHSAKSESDSVVSSEQTDQSTSSVASSEVVEQTSAVRKQTVTRTSYIEQKKESQDVDIQTPPTPTPTNQQPSVSVTPGLLTVKFYEARKLRLPFTCHVPSATMNKLSGSSYTSGNGDLYTDVTAAEIPAVIQIPSSLIKRSLVYALIEFDKTILEIEAQGGSIEQPIFNSVSSLDVSRAQSLNVQIFARIPQSFYPPDYEDDLTQLHSSTMPTMSSSMKKPTHSHTRNSSSFHKRDILIGSCEINPHLSKLSTPVRILNHSWQTLQNTNNSQFCITLDFKPSKNKALSIDDFDLLRVVGKGSFGKVMQVRKKDTQQIYALKTIRKAHIVSRSEVIHTLAERTVLARISNPFICPLKFTFQSPEKLYFVLAFTNGGELFHHLQREGRFDLNRSRFYTAELLIALECLHDYNIIYRDLKPENILLDYAGHISLCDFGLCKLNMKGEDKTNTFCGTPEYLAPELLLGQGYTKVVDWWTLGVLLYEMLTGLPPYYDENVNVMYRKILQDPLRFPDFMDKDARSLISQLLHRDPRYRLGGNGATEIKLHPFFKQIDWKRLYNKGYAPPFKPPVKGKMDTSNFDSEFTSELPADSVVDDYLSESVQKQFGGWTYVGNERLGDGND